mmetsp:Transcript_44113/g.84306  ORF Transcript_44113/g.84306 Transcript_44113/m.84306 type:complete len:331 (+) Transcript_44113:81-1073(+)
MAPLPITLVEGAVWIHGLIMVANHSGDLLAEEFSSAMGLARVNTAASFLIYYAFVKAKVDPFAEETANLFKPLVITVSIFMGILHIIAPYLALLHNLRVIAAVTLVSSAVISAVNCTLELFITGEDDHDSGDLSHTLSQSPFLGRIFGHFMYHSSLFPTFIKHPNQEMFTLVINTFLFPLTATFVAKIWLATAVPFWSAIPAFLWHWSGTYAIVCNILMYIFIADGGVRKDLPRDRRSSQVGGNFARPESSERSGNPNKALTQDEILGDAGIHLPKGQNSDLLEALLYAMKSQPGNDKGEADFSDLRTKGHNANRRQGRLLRKLAGRGSS